VHAGTDGSRTRGLARQHFQAYSRSVWERGILWWASEARLRRLIQLDPGSVPVEQMTAQPTILLCPHFVCLDVAGAAVAMETSASSMYVQQKNLAFDRVLRAGRSRFKPVKLFTRQDGIKPIMRALRDKLPYFMLPDMDFGEKMPSSCLLRHRRCHPDGHGRIAATTGAQVLPVIATFLPNFQGWRVKFYPVWDNYPGTDMVAATRRMNAFIEDRVREAPAEYFWTHKRFKTRPNGEPSLYQRAPKP
jgi:KDO2-lipid IV(A) lauroyltransferase